MEIANKNILVTGGANGLGREIALGLLSDGAKVGVVDVDAKGMEGLRSESGGIVCIQKDISAPGQAQEAVAEFIEKTGNLDVLINNAGIVRNALLVNLSAGKVERHDPELWKKVIDVNLNAVFLMTSLAVENMIQNRTEGVIINISSVCAAGNAGQSAYSAAKAGVNAATVSWAKELGLFKIRVGGIAPGFAETKTTLESVSPEVLEEYKKRTPLRRIAKAGEVVEAARFILKNDFFSGRILEVDGGLRL